MNTYNLILKSIESEIVKCSVTLKSIRKQISPIIKEITNTQSEYDLLMDIIPHFYRDKYKLDHETIIVEDYYYNSYENDDGNENSVYIPNEAITDGRGLLLSIHNHPPHKDYNSSYFPSINDCLAQLELNEKYAVIVGDKGISITKLNEYISDVNIDKFNEIYGNYVELYNGIETDVHNTSDFARLSIEYKLDNLSDEEFDYGATKLLHKYLDNNINDVADRFNSSFDEMGYDLKTYVIPIKRNLR